jgi:hypothetical protein
MNPFRKVYLEQLKSDQHKLDADKDGKIEGEDLAKLRASKKVKKEATEIPFSGPYTKTPAVVTDKSGAKHSPMSRVRHLARAAAATAAKKAEKTVKEEAEELDELNKSTLASYAKKATKDARMQQSIGKDFEAQSKKSRKSSMKDAAQSLADKYKSKSRSREAGIGKAIDRLAKEELTVESDKAYADAMEKQREKMLTQKDQDALSKVRALMAKEKAAKMKKEETDLEEGIIKGTIETGKQAIKVPLKAAKRVVKGVAAAVGGVVDTAKDVKDGVKTIVKKFKEETEQIEEKSDQAKQNKTMKNLMVASKGAQINRGLKLDPADYGYKKAQHLNKAIGRAAMKEEETQMEFTQEELQLIEQFIEIAEKMNLSKATMGDVIKDFKKSDAPQFKGKSEEKKRQMAIAAKLQADRETKKEEVETTLSFRSYLDEVKMADLPVRKVTGRGYGTEYYKKEKEKDEKGYDADDDKEPSEKKGRGRPAGSKSGARQKGSTTGKKKSGVEMTGYPLHLPNR